nr:CDP-alcohol phosphatidyltransferase family protein [Nitrospina gracilis]
MSRHLTRLFIKTPVTPNQITWAHLVLGLISGWYFYLGGYANQLTGAVLLMLSAWLDSTDGEIARLRFQQSPFGGMLDIVADNVVHFAVFLGIGLGLYRMTGSAVYSYMGVVAVAGSLTCFLLLQSDIFSQRTTGSSDGPVEEAESLVDQIANRDFIYFLFVMAVINLLEIFIVVTAIGSVVFAGYVGYNRFKPRRRIQGLPLK